ncbi:hypothetical protein [Actinacidiphila yeochonensis]|uniref:hypothetical protein n=1 Tax=Actinacidiphila yeochonensis TaxID=89050 RepID=UPI001E2EF4C0|nr:hypothetical protein [Actinacidiphila yeochonensis]
MLVRQFPELSEELAPGRGRPREAGHDAETRARAEQARRARESRLLREERQDALTVQQRHGLAVPGHSAAPLRLHVSDAIRDISDGVVELEEAVHAKLGLPLPRRAPVPERLLRVGALLGVIAGQPVLARHVRDEARRMARRCARALGDTEQMVRVPGRCPFCDSVSLRAFPARRAVLCVNPACRCADADCGCRDDAAYRHVWDEAAWGALGNRDGFAAAMDAPPPAAPAGTEVAR